jgi:hypothetical protein
VCKDKVINSLQKNTLYANKHKTISLTTSIPDAEYRVHEILDVKSLFFWLIAQENLVMPYLCSSIRNLYISIKEAGSQ